LTLGYESDRLSQGNLEILQGNVLGHEWRQCTEGISNPSMGQRDRLGGENTLRSERLVGELETLVLGELISPKNSNIPQRNKEIANGGLGDTLTVELEERVVKKGNEEVRGLSLFRYLNPQKSDSPVLNRTVQFCLNRQKPPWIFRPF
jgi:hypothetical protein